MAGKDNFVAVQLKFEIVKDAKPGQHDQFMPDALLNALEVITKSETNHAKRAVATGARGILLAVANANSKELSPADYARFSAPFDKRILDAVNGAPLSFLHLHVDREYLDQFRSFEASVVNYSLHVTGIPISEVRAKFPKQTIAGGIDEVGIVKLRKI